MFGKTITHYKILEKLGEGGMGVVYKAEDTKLKRIVALKFLPRQIAANEEERERFKIEAQAVAALNHPNIATIHAIEEVDDEIFIVMEFIEGKELKQLLIDNSQLPIDHCFAYATQIAEGLKAAHAKSITHRDIKSSNIMVTESGQVKITDFGLAKLAGAVRLTKTGSEYDPRLAKCSRFRLVTANDFPSFVATNTRASKEFSRNAHRSASQSGKTASDDSHFSSGRLHRFGRASCAGRSRGRHEADQGQRRCNRANARRCDQSVCRRRNGRTLRHSHFS